MDDEYDDDDVIECECSGNAAAPTDKSLVAVYDYFLFAGFAFYAEDSGYHLKEVNMKSFLLWLGFRSQTGSF